MNTFRWANVKFLMGGLDHTTDESSEERLTGL